MLELLSPAGSMEALRAAVQNGANAVYLGYDRFNARMGAQNFSADELQEAIVYCHVRGVQVHLTLNTLVSDREMARAAEVIRAAAVFGVDAFIVQDLGMVQLCKEIAPSVPVHASTQMSIHSLEGVVAAAELGCVAAKMNQGMRSQALAYADGIGKAFQIRDDMLDVIGTQSELGKATGMDGEKNTFVRLYGLEKCEELVRKYTDYAISALSVFEDTEYIVALAHSLTTRRV